MVLVPAYTFIATAEAIWIAGATALSARESKIVAGVALMAFDGFAMNVHLPVGIACDAATAHLMARTLIGPAAP